MWTDTPYVTRSRPATHLKINDLGTAVPPHDLHELWLLAFKLGQVDCKYEGHSTF